MGFSDNMSQCESQRAEVIDDFWPKYLKSAEMMILLYVLILKQ